MTIAIIRLLKCDMIEINKIYWLVKNCKSKIKKEATLYHDFRI
jgi:hypothetical protein